MLQLARARHMGPAAQVFECPFTVQRHILTGRDAGDDFRLVQLAHALEVGHRIVTWHNATGDDLVLGCQFDHAFFNGHQVFRRERTLVRKIVEEAMLDHRANGHLCIREQLLHCVGQQVGGGVADHVQTFGILGSDDGQSAVRRDGVAGVHQLSVHLACQCRFGEATADGCGHFGHRHRAGVVSLGAVRKGNLDHDKEKGPTFSCGPSIWWAVQGSNLRPLPCEGSALPLS